MTITFNNRAAELKETGLHHISHKLHVGRSVYDVIRNATSPGFFTVADKSGRVQGYIGNVKGDIKQVSRLG